MKLSKKIRKGSKLAPQVYDTGIINRNNKQVIIGTCAIGAAVHYDNNKKHKQMKYGKLKAFRKKHPELQRLLNFHCGCGEKEITLYDLIIHLNDYHKTTREDIADIIKEFGY